jgi:hypothetical protein
MDEASYQAIIAGYQATIAALIAALQKSAPVVVDPPRPKPNVQIDPITHPGAPNTIYMPRSGHTLSLPVAGEGLLGYAMRVSVQAGGGEDGYAQAGGLINQQVYPTGMAATGDTMKDFPLLADSYYTRISGGQGYMTDAERAADDEARRQLIVRTINGRPG